MHCICCSLAGMQMQWIMLSYRCNFRSWGRLEFRPYPKQRQVVLLWMHARWGLAQRMCFTLKRLIRTQSSCLKLNYLIQHIMLLEMIRIANQFQYRQIALAKGHPYNTTRSSKKGWSSLRSINEALIRNFKVRIWYHIRTAEITATSSRGRWNRTFLFAGIYVWTWRKQRIWWLFSEAATPLLHWILCFYRSENLEGAAVSPSSILAYLRRAQRRLCELQLKLNLFNGSIFADPKDRLVAALDNIFSEKKSEGRVTKSHKILTTDDVKIIYHSECCNEASLEGYLTRIVFVLILCTDVQTTEIWQITLAHLTKEGQLVMMRMYLPEDWKHSWCF